MRPLIVGVSGSSCLRLLIILIPVIPGTQYLIHGILDGRGERKGPSETNGNQVSCPQNYHYTWFPGISFENSNLLEEMQAREYFHDSKVKTILLPYASQFSL